MKISIPKISVPVWLVVILIVVFVLRIPSFFEPYSYGDEMIYLTLGNGIRQGIPLYSGLHDNKPPLLYLTAAIAGNLFWFKAILTIWHAVTVIVFSKLANVLFPKKEKLQIIATVIFAIFTTIPLLEGHIANAEIFMVGPTIMAFYVLLTRKGLKNIFIAGVLFSIAALFKIPAAFELPVIIVFWFINIKKISRKEVVIFSKKSFVLIAGFLFPILLTFVWYFFQGAFKEYFIAAFAQNFGYISSWRPDDVQKPFLQKNGPLLVRGIFVAIISMFLLARKKHFSKQFVFLSLWVVFALFAVTLSERPYPHYLIQAMPSVSLLFGVLLTFANYEQVYVLFPLGLAFLVPYYYNFWHYPTIPYYQRFVNLGLGRINKENYLRSFGGQIPSVYQISEYVANSTATRENIFVWGDTATIYALSKRLPPIKYIADYHIRDFSNIDFVIDKLESGPVSLLILLKDSNPPPQLSSYISKNYSQVYNVEGSTVWKPLNKRLKTILQKP